ncbi:MAG: DUF4145 domain-containing protein [Gemmataceae bacterium]
MPIDRKLWMREIHEGYVPNWTCPRCGAASLNMVKDSFRTVFDSSTSRYWNEPDFDSDSATGRFVCLLECSKPACRESCAVSGNHDMTRGGEYGDELYATGRPTSISPPPPMIRVPDECPKPIANEVRAAFGLFWMDHSSALNRIRNAIELLLTEMGVKRHGQKAGGGRTRLSLDSRIALLRSKKPKLSGLCDQLLAVKHLGNAGSHPGDVQVKDVFDGFDILEQILNDTYANHASVLAKMVKQINQRKGPRKNDRK